MQDARQGRSKAALGAAGRRPKAKKTCSRRSPRCSEVGSRDGRADPCGRQASAPTLRRRRRHGMPACQGRQGRLLLSSPQDKLGEVRDVRLQRRGEASTTRNMWATSLGATKLTARRRDEDRRAREESGHLNLPAAPAHRRTDEGVRCPGGRPAALREPRLPVHAESRRGGRRRRLHRGARRAPGLRHRRLWDPGRDDRAGRGAAANPPDRSRRGRAPDPRLPCRRPRRLGGRPQGARLEAPALARDPARARAARSARPAATGSRSTS